jgi:tetratricopeptide (TPR) repeat protein
MGRVEEVLNPCDTLEDPNELKEAGNAAYKQDRFDDAVDCYTKAIKVTKDDEKEKSTYYKNRAQAHLKLENWECAIADCNKALELVPKDPKAYFRRCQAYEALEQIDKAYIDAKEVHNLDPKNKAIEPILVRLHGQVQNRLTEMAETGNKVKSMFDIVFKLDEDNEKREKAADNLIVLSRERSGAEMLFKNDVIPKIVRLLKVEKNKSIRLSCIRVFGELAKKDVDRAKCVLKEAGIPYFLDALNTHDEETVTASSYVIQCLLDSLSRADLVKKWAELKKDQKRMATEDRKKMRNDEERRQEIMKENGRELYAIMHVVCFNTTSRTLTGEARDALINIIMKNCPWDQMNWAEKMMKTDAYQRLMEVASELTHFKHESAMEITDSTNTIVGVCFGHLYEQMWDDARRNGMIEEIEKFTMSKLMDQDLESKVRITVAITTLLKHAPDLGNSQLTKEGVLQMMMVMARSEEHIQQIVASEALIAAAAKKKDASAIISQGMDILKELYKSKDDHIKVRALVGMCKLGASGGHDATLRPFADGSTTKLAEACRRFLISPGKDIDLRRWAAEGLSFLTLDADVKEKLVEDEPAMKALIELGKTGKQDVAYGVITTLVNLTNSYDKQEINAEMLELAKFAKHHIPEDHELDDEDFVDKRIWTIADLGVTSALVALAKTESKNLKELIARVLNSMCKHRDLRGLVVQQGGSKVLVNLALEGTDKGRRTSAQALSRIGITQDPSIAFPGQRSCDIVRPICKLLEEEYDSIENFESLMALGNLAVVNESVRGRILKNSEFICAIENYMYEDHQMLRRASVQAWCNLCLSPIQVERCEGNNDKMKYIILLCGDDEDAEIVKAASGAVAMLTSVSTKCCKKVFDSKQWTECLLNLLASLDVEVCLRGTVTVDNMVSAGKEVAEPIMDTQIMDCLQALIAKANLDLGNAEPNPVLQKIKLIAEHALKQAHELKVIKTYDEGVKEYEEDDKLESWKPAPKPGGSGDKPT